ncbi:MAG: neutral zinc metallopeptidase [Leptolyngbyaceae cyanobacterium bins.349]|nr:neutral zinc metallopeptidase [Leptolyngbyaceae cyanobacterium bins.349]
MKKLKAFMTAAISAGCVLAAAPVKAELAPEAVANGVYQGIQHIHGYKATPKLVFNVSAGQRGGCGLVRGSHYCGRNHTVYITQQDIRLAYQHGDAALAYIIAHEYAHAMQVAFGFMPRSVPAAELQADCLAGVYLGAIPNLTLDERDVQEVATFAYRVGDYAQWSRQHHGTPAQRVKAVATGLQASSKGKGVAACRLN